MSQKRRKNRAKTLAETGEDDVVKAITKGLVQQPHVICGPGDDCAVLDVGSRSKWQLLKTDAIVEGVHFLPTAPPQDVGWKAVCRAVSDIAAMGGVPSSAVITVVLRPSLALSSIQKLYKGFEKAARRFGLSIVGGETARGPEPQSPIMINVAMQGWVDKKHLTLRSGARSGDAIFVTGVLGGSINGWHLSFQPRVEQAAWLVRHFKPSAMMDLSDGLAKDWPRLAAMSQINPHFDLLRLPVRKGCTSQQALSDGEDYELLFTLPAVRSDKLQLAWKEQFPKLRLTCIGYVGTQGAALAGGWDHFQTANIGLLPYSKK